MPLLTDIEGSGRRPVQFHVDWRRKNLTEKAAGLSGCCPDHGGDLPAADGLDRERVE
jgi:hypothetical protein